MILRFTTGLSGAISTAAGLVLLLSPPSLSVTDAVEGFQRYQTSQEVQITGKRPLGLGSLLLLTGLINATLVLVLPKQLDPIPEAITDPPPGQSLASADPPSGQKPKSVDRPKGQPIGPHITCLDDALLQRVSFAQLAGTADYETRVKLLAKSLKSFEGGWVWRLLRCPCLLVIGRPGAGKSSFAGAIAIIREVLGITLDTTVCDPNAHLKLGKNVWFDRWEICGARDQWDEIGDALENMYLSFAHCTNGNHGGWLYDEVTCYKDHVDETKLGGFLGQVTSKARATQDYVTVISHNDTLQTLGGKAGEAGLKDDMVALYLSSVGDRDGNLKPAGKGLLKGADYSDDLKPLETPVTVPRWLDAAFLCQLFPDVYDGNAEGSEMVTPQQVLAVGNRLGTAALPTSELDEAPDMTGIRALKAHIEQACGVTLSVAAIRNALTALGQGEAPSRVIKKTLGFEGRNYNTGQEVLTLLNQFLHPLAGDQ